LFKVKIHKKVAREILRLPKNIREQILDAIRNMRKDPFSGDVKPIKGVRGVFRRRVGDYRIAFSVDFENKIIVILRIGHRRSFY